MKRNLFFVLLVLVLAITGCAGATATTAPESGGDTAATDGYALSIIGKVGTESSFPVADLEGMEVVEVTAELKGETATYRGVKLNALLEQVAPASDASELAIRASDGFEAVVPMADIQGCADCLVAFADDGSLRMVMPGLTTKSWVKQVVEIEVR